MASPPVGLALPAIRTAGGYFVSKNEYDTAWGNVILAIMTPAGGRPMRRSQGSALYNSLFDQMDPATMQLIQRRIVDAVAQQVPTVNINSVDIQTGRGTVSLRVTFSLAKDAATLASRSVTVSKSGTILQLQGARQ